MQYSIDACPEEREAREFADRTFDEHVEKLMGLDDPDDVDKEVNTLLDISRLTDLWLDLSVRGSWFCRDVYS